MATQDQLNSTMECPVCLDLLNKPKLLSCSHTFCKRCLSTLYAAQQERDRVCCPLCRKPTNVTGGDISKLGTNHVVRSLIDELLAKIHNCAVCKEQTPAVIFCADCDKYMCDSCKQKHDGWEMFSGHEEFSMEDVNAGKTGSRKKGKCNRHGSEIRDFWCLECRIYICLRCRMVDHLKHDVIEADDHEKSHKEKITALLALVNSKKNKLDQDKAFIKEARIKVHTAVQKPMRQIGAARYEAIRHINERSAFLFRKCKEHEYLITSKLERIVGETDMQSACIESAGELVKNGMRGMLEGDALVAHDTLCQELENRLKGYRVEYRKIGDLSSCAAGLEFKTKKGSVELGDLEQRKGWELCAEKALMVKESMNGMAASPDGRMAVGCCKGGGIENLSADGQRQQTLVKDVPVRGVAFLSDARYVVRDTVNRVSLYTSECEKLDVQFETLTHDKGGIGDLTVGSDDQIYVNYRKAKKIQVFTPSGGKAVSEIPCIGYEPMQIFSMKSNTLIVKAFSNSVMTIDTLGKKQHAISKGGDILTHPCVSQDGSILISWVKYKEGLVTIDRYTDELRHVQTLIADHKIEKSERNWYYLQEFLTGEIAFCTPNKVYIFHHLATPADL